MRIVIAAVIGGLLMFFWGAIAHMVLGLGDVGVNYGTPHAQTMSALQAEAPKAGIYLLPSPEQSAMQDEAKMQAYAQEHGGKPYAFVVHQPAGNSGMVNMGPNLGKQFATDTAAALLLAIVLAGLSGFGKRVTTAALMGVFAWLVVQLPYWNWYGFPMDYTLGVGAKYLLGWAIAGAGMAWWLGRGGK